MARRKDKGHASIIGILADVDSSAITVRQARCAMVRNRNADCLRCADACTSGCISLVQGVLQVDPSKCVGCGTCATVCPTCALEAHNPTDAQLSADLERALGDGRAAILCRPCAEACAEMLDRRLFAQVVCLGRVDESALMRLVSAGAREIDLVCGDCDRCAQRRGRECARMVVDSARQLLDAWQVSVRIEVTDRIPERLLMQGCVIEDAQQVLGIAFAKGAGNPPVHMAQAAAAASSHEAYGDGCASGSTTNAYAAQVRSSDYVTDAGQERMQVIKVMKDGTLPHFVPSRRERLLDALSALGEPKAEFIESRLWGCVAIDARACISCRMCSTFCPTGALRRFDDALGFGVEHFPGDCVRCGSCQAICPASAIRIEDRVRITYLLDGAVHRFSMRPRPVQLNNPQQILDTMKSKIPGNVYER